MGSIFQHFDFGSHQSAKATCTQHCIYVCGTPWSIIPIPASFTMSEPAQGSALVLCICGCGEYVSPAKRSRHLHHKGTTSQRVNQILHRRNQQQRLSLPLAQSSDLTDQSAKKNAVITQLNVANEYEPTIPSLSGVPVSSVASMSDSRPFTQITVPVPPSTRLSSLRSAVGRRHVAQVDSELTGSVAAEHLETGSDDEEDKVGEQVGEESDDADAESDESDAISVMDRSGEVDESEPFREAFQREAASAMTGVFAALILLEKDINN